MFLACQRARGGGRGGEGGALEWGGGGGGWGWGVCSPGTLVSCPTFSVNGFIQ